MKLPIKFTIEGFFPKEAVSIDFSNLSIKYFSIKMLGECLLNGYSDYKISNIEILQEKYNENNEKLK